MTIRFSHFSVDSCTEYPLPVLLEDKADHVARPVGLAHVMVLVLEFPEPLDFVKLTFANRNCHNTPCLSPQRGMKFVGSVTIYSYLQAIGVLNSQEDGCWCD